MNDILTFLGGLKHEINLVYGKAGSGKTTLALQAALALARENKKILFLDTEGGFNVERFQQMAGEQWTELLDKIVVMRMKSFFEQYDCIRNIMPLASKFSLVIVDTLGHWYRQELQKDATATNKIMDRQLHLLFELSRKVPVLLTNQVSADITNNRVASVGGNMVLKWCQRVIELEKDPRTMIMHKPEEKKQSFDIINSGLVLR